MSFAVRQAWPSDLERIVALGAACQVDPNRCCPQLSTGADALRAELEEIDGWDDWTAATWVAVDDARELLGWLAAERDEAMGRVWWFGPFVADATSPLTEVVTDALLSAAMRSLEDCTEFELVADVRSTLMSSLAMRNGLRADEASLALRLDALPVGAAAGAASAPSEPVSGVRVLITPVAISPGTISPGRVGLDEAGVAVVDPCADAIVLHDQLFPGTHSDGARLFGLTDDRHDRFVARVEGRLVGYIATELQHDGSLYIDYLGVAPAGRAGGVGRALVGAALQARADGASHAHLTVRAANTAARRVYDSLGFVEELELVPYRRGFTLD